jgi:hypothetical protein
MRRIESMLLCLAVAGLQTLAAARSQQAAEQRLAPRRVPQNPLITVNSSKTLGGNVNGPTVIRVPAWVERPLGRYYMYFANHMGDFVRFAYADSVTGPWTIYEPGVLHVKDTAFYRPQPDPAEMLADFYTHVASPEILVDAGRRQIVMWVHGWWTQGERWPLQPAEARTWARAKGYGQYTQAAVSSDGLHFTVQPAITRTSYLRVFERDGAFYGVSRLGLVSRASDRLGSFEPGPLLFRASSYANRVRHVGLVLRGSRMYVFFTGIGDAPERVLVSSVELSEDWRSWKASTPLDVLSPEAPYECIDLPNAPSDAGDIDHPARQIRDPFVFEDGGKTFLFYSTCGEQGIAAAEIALP